jgi:hypothetical protein
MTTLKVDSIIFTTVSGDGASPVSGAITSGQYAVLTGVINPVNGNVITTGMISGGIFKVSGNLTVINVSGGVSPYGLYTLPSGAGTRNTVVKYIGSATTEWNSPSVTTAMSIALGKC